ncbi:hypothetical protein D3C75_1082520 [compost metagenome]
MIRADQQRRTFGQPQLLHDRFGEAQWLVGDHAPDQVGFLDIGEQLGHAVEQLAVHRTTDEVALQELQAQRFEPWRFRIHGEGHGDHRLGTAGNLVADVLVVHWGQAAVGTHRLTDRNEVWRGVEQGAVHVEKNCSDSHRLIPRAGSGSCS